VSRAVGGDGPAFAEGRVTTVFRSRRKPDAEAEYHRASHEMRQRARAMPDFVEFKTFTAEDGEKVSLITFATSDAQRQWRDDLRHRAADQRGRDAFYLGYSVEVGECTYVSQWKRSES
jgi:heme-degrading monooxygenase HmoA